MDDRLDSDLQAIWKAWIGLLDGAWSKLPPESCVLAVRLATSVLRTRGHRYVIPLPVGVIHANKAARAAMIEGVPTANWPPHAHATAIEPGRTRDIKTFWPGHLVVCAVRPERTTILDLAAGQLSLPDHPLSVVLASTHPSFPAARKMAAWSMPTGSAYQITDARPILGTSFRACDDWATEYRAHLPEFEAAVMEHAT